MKKQQITLPSAHLKAAQAFRARLDVRYYLNGVCLRADGAVEATNGHVLFRADCEACSQLESDLILDWKEAIPKESDLSIVQILDRETALIRCMKKDRTIKLIGALIVDGAWPDTDSVLSKAKKNKQPSRKIGLNPAYLSVIEKASKAYQQNDYTVVLSVAGAGDPILVRCNNNHFIALIMPKRL